MLGNLLIASCITLPYWLFQKATNKPVEPGKTYRLRLFTGAFGTLTAIEIAFLLALAPHVGDNKGAANAIGRNLALPTIVLATGLATKKGWMREPFKRYEPTVES
tara:strand:+ start:218 stop:532 length:315 start_codon:yes stop_codon:yes gene_type:complete